MGRRGKTQPFIVTQPKTSIEPKHAGAVAVAVAVYTPCPAHSQYLKLSIPIVHTK